MKKRLLLLGVFLITLNLNGQQCKMAFPKCGKQCTVANLEDTYKAAQQTLACLDAAIKALPKENQHDLVSLFNTTRSSVVHEYRQSKKVADDAEKHYAKNPATKNHLIDQYATASIRKIKDNCNHLREAIINTQQAAGHSIKLEEQEKKAIKLAQQEAAYHQKVMALFQELKTGIATFNVVSAEAHAILFDLQRAQKYNDSFMARIEKVTKKWKDLTQQFDTIYRRHNQAIRIDDSTNYVVICIRAMIYFYIHLIEMQLQQASVINKEEVYPLLSLLVTQILGIGGSDDTVRSLGYDATVKNLINQYFKENQAYLNKTYLQSKVDLTFECFQTYLLQLQRNPNPEKQLPYAEKFYTLIMSDNKVLPRSVQDQTIESVNHVMAILYVLSIQKVLKEMRIDQDTTVLRNAAIKYYQKAAEYYRKAQDEVNAKSAAASYANLNQASQAWTTAQASQKTGDLENAVAFFKIAQAGFQSAGDVVDAALAGIQLLNVEAQFAAEQAQSVIKVVKQNSTHYADYITNVSSPTITPEKEVSQFHDLLALINQGYKSIFQYYLNAVAGYQTLAEQDSSATPSKEIVARMHILNLAASLLQKVIEAHEFMVQADKLMDANAVVTALSSYKNAIHLYQAADQIYTKNPDLAPYYPLYPAVASAKSDVTYTVVAYRHIAKKLIERAAKTSDTVTSLQYYYTAHLSNHYLTVDMQTFLNETLKKIAAQQGVVQQLFEQAQKNENEAMSLANDSWKPVTGVGYISKATALWENVLQHYNAVLFVGDEEAKGPYVRAIDEYAKAYLANVPAAYYPALGAALIHYHHYVFSVIENNEQQAEVVLKNINNLITPMFTKIEKLIAAVDTPSLIISSSDNQVHVVQWQNHLEQALIKQDTILSELAPKLSDEQRKTLILFTSSTDEQGNVTYTFLPTKQSIILLNPALKLADVTKQLGDYYFQKNNYILAYAAYTDAQNQYKNGNRFDRVSALQQQFDKAKTLYYATLYQESVIPINSIVFNGFKAPASYDLKMYKQTVPDAIVKGFPTSEQLKAYTPEKTDTFTISVMIDVYMYWWIRLVFGQTRYLEIIKIMKPLLGKNKEAVDSGVKKALDNEVEQTDVSNIIMNATAFQKELTDRVARKITSFVLREERTKDGATQYTLYEYHIPMVPFPIISLDSNNKFYMGYPSAYLFYNWSAQLFAPGNDRIVVNGASFAPGNKPDKYQELHDDILKVYFSQVSLYQAKIDAIKKSDSYKRLITIDKNDLKPEIADYLDIFNGIQENYQNMITYCDNALNESFMDRKSSKGKKINALIGDLYKKLGDELTVFLIGDPRDKDYHVTVLGAISTAYANAIINYGYDSSLYKTYAELCKKGGDILAKHALYFVSTRLYIKAEKAYRNIVPKTQELTDLADAVALIRLKNVCKAATINVGNYNDARNNGVTLTNDSGTTRKVPIRNLINEYNMTLQQAGGAEGVKGLNIEALHKLNTLKSGLLDSLIFYSGAAVGSKNPLVAGFALLIESVMPQADDATNTHIKSGASKILTDFFKKNNLVLKNEMSIDAVATVTAALKQDNFLDGKNLAEVIQHAFDSFEQLVNTAKTPLEKASALAALNGLCTLLYNSFGSLYINDFLGGFPKVLENLVVTINNLNGSIDTEINAMNSATWQFFVSSTS